MADTIIFMSKGKILQQASPEEMLSNPADPIIKDFMGKLSYSRNSVDLTSADVMKKNVFKVQETKKTLECIELMKSKEIGSLVIVDEKDKFKGIVTVEHIREYGKPGEYISKLAITDFPTVLITTSAKDAFELLIETKKDYIIVLGRNGAVVGIITKTSMTKALATLVWGDDN
jgi:osmoprotectant transport system ATP-binding protein